MKSHAGKTHKDESRAIAKEVSRKQGAYEATVQFADNRPRAVAQQKLQMVPSDSPQIRRQAAISEMANDSPQSEQAAPLQAIADEYAVQQQPPGLEKEYETGLHDDLKSGIEKLSGFAINGDVLLEREADVMGAKALQPGYSSPNTSEVPEALNATIVQRKHADLGYAELDEILEQKLKDKIVRYNQSTLLSTLQGQPQRDQAGKDVLLLDVILSDLGDYFDKYPDSEQLLSFYQTTYAHQTGAKDIRDAPETEVSEVHTVHFTGFPKIKKPEHKQKVFSGVEYIEATINQKNCRLYAFQNYLNTEYSTQLWDKPPEKGGTIPLMKIFSPEEEEANYENWAVTDAHHRFVWRAHHGQKVEVTLGKFNVPKSDAHAWSKLTYVHDPKQSYQFKADDKWATEAFHAAISPLFPYSGWFKDDPEAFITYTLKHIHRLGEDLFIEEPNITRLKSYISGKLQVAEVNTYREAVKKLVGSARDKESAEAKAAILLESLPSARMPNVAFATAPSTGYMSPQFNVIILDPDKNPTSDALLDTLAYETGNIERREEYLAGERTTVDIEFEATESYVDLLIEATGAGGINQLVVDLGIPEEYLTLASANESLAARKLIPEMPDESVLGEQAKRTALASWKTQDWTEEQRKQYFATSEHGKGMKATASEYEAQVPSPPVTVDEIQENVTRPPPSFRPLVYAMIRAYPGADSSHFAELSPRHFGEFLLMGKVNKWELKRNDREPGAHREILQILGEELVKKYPNADNIDFKNMTYADIGEFLLNGEIQTWETPPH